MKKIVFFDGDGTLWYPRETKRTRIPWWIYEAHPDNYLELLELDPDTVDILNKLKENSIKVIILSTHPCHLVDANNVLKKKIRHLSLTGLIDRYFATEEYYEAKAEKIMELLAQYGFKKEDALMVGDSYNWDYRPAETYGIDAVLVDSLYHQERKELEPAEKTIKKLSELKELSTLLDMLKIV